ncbi:MAG: VOC family protein [Pseudomonadota bacterium]|nr:VOC family protein [Pseudomonadota bacterium]
MTKKDREVSEAPLASRLSIGPARQISFVTSDLQRAMAHFAGKLGVGPWFFEPKITFKRNVYRGRDTNAEIAAGLAYSGPIQFEVIQPLDDEPSVYREYLNACPDWMLLQHINMWVEDLGAAVQSAVAEGYEVVQESATALGGLYYLSHPQFAKVCLELSDLGPVKRRIFEAISDAAADWDGSRPIRKGFPLE